MGLDVGGCGTYGVIVGDVDLDESDAEAFGGSSAALAVAGAQEDGVTELGEAAGSLEAEALVGPGDEGGCHE